MPLRMLRCRLAYVLDVLFYPFTTPEIVNSLQRSGFTLLGQPPTIWPGPRMYVSGRLAAKEGGFVDVEADRKLIAAEASSAEVTLRLAEQISAISSGEFGFDLEDRTDYIELLSSMLVETGSSPRASIEGLFSSAKLDALSSHLGTPLKPYGMVLATAGKLPTEKEWFEIRAEPRSVSPSQTYYVELIYRSQKPRKVLDFAARMEQTVLGAIKIIEE